MAGFLASGSIAPGTAFPGLSQWRKWPVLTCYSCGHSYSLDAGFIPNDDPDLLHSLLAPLRGTILTFIKQTERSGINANVAEAEISGIALRDWLGIR